MGYTTYFEGGFEITPTLKPEDAAYLRKFSGTRRMSRREGWVAQTKDPIREAVGLPALPEYYVAAEGFCGQEHDDGIIDYNRSPQGQPGLWCQWVPTEDGTALVWDEGEKFYEYEAWLDYLIEHFLEPWGYRLHGEVRWEGEDSSDQGIIRVRDNEVRVWHSPPIEFPEWEDM